MEFSPYSEIGRGQKLLYVAPRIREIHPYIERGTGMMLLKGAPGVFLLLAKPNFTTRPGVMMCDLDPENETTVSETIQQNPRSIIRMLPLQIMQMIITGMHIIDVLHFGLTCSEAWAAAWPTLMKFSISSLGTWVNTPIICGGEGRTLLGTYRPDEPAEGDEYERNIDTLLRARGTRIRLRSTRIQQNGIANGHSRLFQSPTNGVSPGRSSNEVESQIDGLQPRRPLPSLHMNETNESRPIRLPPGLELSPTRRVAPLVPPGLGPDREDWFIPRMLPSLGPNGNNPSQVNGNQTDSRQPYRHTGRLPERMRRRADRLRSRRQNGINQGHSNGAHSALEDDIDSIYANGNGSTVSQILQPLAFRLNEEANRIPVQPSDPVPPRPPRISSIELLSTLVHQAWAFFGKTRDVIKDCLPPDLRMPANTYIRTGAYYPVDLLTIINPCPANLYKTEPGDIWVLRSLTVRQYIRSTDIALHPGYISGPFIMGIGFSEAVFAMTIWTDTSKGRWAGHALDIVPLSKLEAEDGEWEDVGRVIAGYLHHHFRRHYGADWIEETVKLGW
ncbi:hypothetical protein MGYG_01121 [Nannizzia gypsea CBS 118893]|uniref:Uncharacterized protein n=1 Tax=Arthroderma gypseum (strain ATCC MYA-4604 / CBS 118893) TaxID=535722 RepID=E5QYW2_ARTGP|nr:hypothetical protein MGYG_01121 [Nannizzia gypsea CBS 118893]EFQ98085.1 hypothetical protein MGYG_01121 [Nannizzia gypsea CBS 118893]